MGIYIKGMEMPHDCDECKLCAFIPVGDYVINRKCLPLNAKAEICIRRSDCPLVPVPPHGRLIDVDALMKRMWEETDCMISVPATFVRDAPTIIPAEEGET